MDTDSQICAQYYQDSGAPFVVFVKKTPSCMLVACGFPACISNISNYSPTHTVTFDSQIFLVLPALISNNPGCEPGILFCIGTHCVGSYQSSKKVPSAFHSLSGDFGYRRCNQMLKYSTSHLIQTYKVGLCRLMGC